MDRPIKSYPPKNEPKDQFLTVSKCIFAHKLCNEAEASKNACLKHANSISKNLSQQTSLCVWEVQDSREEEEHVKSSLNI